MKELRGRGMCVGVERVEARATCLRLGGLLLLLLLEEEEEKDLVGEVGLGRRLVVVVVVGGKLGVGV